MKSFSYNFYFTTEYTEFHGVKSDQVTTRFHRATVIASPEVWLRKNNCAKVRDEAIRPVHYKIHSMAPSLRVPRYGFGRTTTQKFGTKQSFPIIPNASKDNSPIITILVL